MKRAAGRVELSTFGALRIWDVLATRLGRNSDCILADPSSARIHVARKSSRLGGPSHPARSGIRKPERERRQREHDPFGTRTIRQRRKRARRGAIIRVVAKLSASSADK